jgi:PAS domain S-box-containing protein
MPSIILIGCSFVPDYIFSAVSAVEPASMIESLSVEQLLARVQRNNDIDLVVIGANVPNPIRVTQAIHTFNKDIAVLILCSPHNIVQIRDALRFTPLLGQDVSCQIETNSQAISDLTTEMLERRGRRQRHQAVVATANRQIKSNSGLQPLAAHYLNHILDFAPIGIIHFDAKGTILAWSHKATDLLGKAERDVLGTNLFTLFPTAVDLFESVLMQPAVDYRETNSRVIERPLPAGVAQFVSVTVVPLRIPNEPAGAIALLEDITQRVVAERMRDDLLERERDARKAAEAAKEHLALLAVAGTELNSSLDLETMLANLAGVLLTTLADWCIIDLVDSTGAIRRVTVVAKDPQKQHYLDELQAHFPPHWNSPQPPVEAMKTGQSVFIPVMTAEIIKSRTFGADHTRLMQALETKSSIAVPLIARQRVIGAVTITRTSSSTEYYKHEDLILAQEIAYRAALAVDNALLYAETNAQREQLHVTLASIGDGVIATDQQGQITFMNRVAESLTGWRNSDAVGKPLEEVFHIINEYSRKPVENPVTKVIQSGVIVELANHTLLIRRDGAIIPISDSGAPIFSQTNELVGVVLVFRDVTQQRLARRRLANLQYITSNLSRALTLEQVIDVIVKEGLAFMKAKEGGFALLNDDERSVRLLTSFSPMAPLPLSLNNVPLTEDFMTIEVIRGREAIWVENIENLRSRYATAQQLASAQGVKAVAAIPLIIEEKVIGALSLGFEEVQQFDEETRTYLASIAEQCAQAIARVQLTRKAQEASMLEERHRLARELHDAVSQTLFATTMMADGVLKSWERDPKKTIERLQEITVLNRAALGEMRTLLLELRPEAILKTDLNQLMRQLLEVARGRQQLETDLKTVNHDLVLPPDVHVAFYRIAQESINNALKHSHASKLSLHLQADQRIVSLHIRDNGLGFDTQQLSPGMGLGNMRQRAAQAGATLNITSEPGQGTTIALNWLNSNNH